MHLQVDASPDISHRGTGPQPNGGWKGVSREVYEGGEGKTGSRMEFSAGCLDFVYFAWLREKPGLGFIRD